MQDAGEERSRWWPSILVLQLHSGSVGPASRVDIGQFNKIILYIISYMYMYMYYNQPIMSPPLTSRISSAPTFGFGKIVPSGLKMGAEHSNIEKVI